MSKRSRTKDVCFTMASQEEDRISSLPDCLLVEILSRLDDTKFAIRTGALSKRWQHLWPQVSNLLFTRFVYSDTRILRFYRSLRRILLTPTPQLNKFKLHAYNDHQIRVSNCIRKAISRNVQEIDFDICHHHRFRPGQGVNRFVLPDFFFICSSFTRVRLCHCLFKQAGVISWENLRTLHIEEAELDEDMIGNILSGSPLLETLELDSCYGFERIDITTNKSVKNLGLFLNGCRDPIQINAPYILTLAIKGNLMLNDFMLLNVSSLINIELNYPQTKHEEKLEETLEEMREEMREEQEMNEEMLEETHKEMLEEMHKEQGMNEEILEEMLKGHLLNLAHANEVKLGKLCLQTLARLKSEGFIIPSNVKLLGEIA